MNAKRSPNGFVQALRRRGRVIVVVALTAMAAASVVSLVLPKSHSAEARLEIGTTGTLDGAAFEASVATVREHILSRDGFDAVAAKLDLDARFGSLPQADRGRARDALMAGIRDRTSVALRPTGANSALASVSASDGDADVAARVVAALAEHAQRLSLDQPVAAQEKAAAELAKAAADAQATSDRAAAEHAAHRESNREFLGGAGKKLQTTREQKKQLRDVTIANLEEQKKKLDEMLAQEKQYEVVTTRQPDAVRLAGVNERIIDVRERLRQLTVDDKRTDTDSEVVAQRTRLAELEDERKKMIAEAPQVEARQQNEQWAQLTQARADVQSQLDAASRQLRLLAATEKAQEELAKRTPEIEAKDKALETAANDAKRDADARTAAASKAETELGELRARGTLTIRAAGDDAADATNPAAAGALVLALGGLAVGAIGGVVAALTLDRMDRSFREAESVAGFLGVTTMGVIGVIETPAETAQRRALDRRSSVAVAALAVFAFVVVALAVSGSSGAIAGFVKSVVG